MVCGALSASGTDEGGMKFDLRCVPAGIPARALRGFLRAYRHVGWPANDYPKPDPRRISRSDVAEWFGKRGLAEALVEKGLLEETSRGQYRVTEFGNRLAPQLLLPRLNRAKADWIVADFLDRVAKINNDAEQINCVVEVVAFGSYISDTNDLGDIDLVVYRHRKPMSLEEYGQRSEALRIQATKVNKLFRDPYYWDEQDDFRKRLRNRCPYLSFHPESDLKDNPRKVIFESPIESGNEPRWAV
jgi:predicted nucleotidyltransferase